MQVLFDRKENIVVKHIRKASFPGRLNVGLFGIGLDLSFLTLKFSRNKNQPTMPMVIP